MKKPIETRQKILTAFLKGDITQTQAADSLGCTARTIRSYRKVFLEQGFEGLKDHRHSNNQKLTKTQEDKIILCKQQDGWRSARNIRDKFKLKVHEATVWRKLKEKGLTKQNLERVKPIIRFEAKLPNDLWQTDIMGKITFPNLGTLYLIATLDDHSRFVLSGRWFRTQGKMNVFTIWYEALSRWGLPKAMLQDEGSQYKARTRFGATDYEWYAKTLKIELIWATRAQVKGKIERFWRFVQDDFVREVWNEKDKDKFAAAFRVWLARYNYVFKSRYFGNQTRNSMYHRSDRRLSAEELRSILTIEERRKVTRESTVSLYGKYYYLPPGYISCRVWIKIIGNKIYFESMGKIFWKARLKLS